MNAEFVNMPLKPLTGKDLATFFNCSLTQAYRYRKEIKEVCKVKKPRLIHFAEYLRHTGIM